jgi:SAM-dependent methyltransferase
VTHYVAEELRVRRDRLFAQARGEVLDLATDGLDHASDSFDTVLSFLYLCTVDDLDATLRRIDALLAPGGRLLALEHVRGTGWRGRLQDASTPLWRHVAGGCRADRDPIYAMRRAGFAVTDCDRFTVHRGLPIVAPHISAVAVRRVAPSTERVAE